MSHPKTVDLEALLRILHDAGVEFIVVGGVAAVLHGAPITTQDLDIVHRQTPENIERLLAVLEELDALFRPVLPERRIKPAFEHLAGRGHLNLSTNLGPLDPLCVIDERTYDDLIEHTEDIADGNLTLRVLDLSTLIEIKSRTGRAKDRMVLPILLAVSKQRGQE